MPTLVSLYAKHIWMGRIIKKKKDYLEPEEHIFLVLKQQTPFQPVSEYLLSITVRLR